MKSFLILILLLSFIDFSTHEEVNQRVTRNFFYRRYLSIIDEKTFKSYISDDFMHTLCTGEVLKRNKDMIMEDVKNINNPRTLNEINVENAVFETNWMSKSWFLHGSLNFVDLIGSLYRAQISVENKDN